MGEYVIYIRRKTLDKCRNVLLCLHTIDFLNLIFFFLLYLLLQMLLFPKKIVPIDITTSIEKAAHGSELDWAAFF